MELVVVGIVSFLTGILSAVAGLGGGIILLVVLAQFHPPVVAIPIQGGIQLWSNTSRTLLLRRDVEWGVVLRMSVLMVPASLLGAAAATSLPENAARLLLGCFVLIVTWRPGMLKWRGTDSLPSGALVGVGAFSGFLNSSFGASGPFTSPFLRAVTATHVAYVATAAATQVGAHVSKLIAFGNEGFDFSEHLPTMGVGSLGVIGGTWLGTRLLGKGDEKRLGQLFRTVLTLLALRLVLGAIAGLL